MFTPSTCNQEKKQRSIIQTASQPCLGPSSHHTRFAIRPQYECGRDNEDQEDDSHCDCNDDCDCRKKNQNKYSFKKLPFQLGKNL